MSANRPLNWRQAARIAAEHGVTVEHLKATIKARRAYRTAHHDRKRHRKKMKPMRASFGHPPSDKVLNAGEGELHGLLKAIGLSEPEFYKLVGIDQSVFHRWYGHPLHSWPIIFLRYYARAQAMGRYLDGEGVDLQQFEAQLPPRLRQKEWPGRPAHKKPEAPELDRTYTPWLKKPPAP